MKHAILVLWLLAAATSFAQDGGISCRLLGFTGAAPPPLVTPAPGGAFTACEVPAGSLSERVKCHPAGGSIRFYQAPVAAAPAGRPAAPRLIATVAVPAAAKTLILVFVPAGEHAEPPWRVMAIDDSAATFPDGGAYVANFHQQELRFLIGEHRVQLAKGGTKSVPRPARRDEFNMAPVIFQFMQDGQWRTASESTLRFTTGARHLLIGYLDPASQRPRIFTCTDVRSEEPVKGKDGSDRELRIRRSDV